ncbi:uncharacterized protein LOC115225419 [Octopus sinensis]|uniref:Uncharacterized protein LOC115225419 n=1 Tax=Octopus sinensis TaxID=2607531 RepID=A0A6P7TK44_9MOLL|nr:uncharacterized protein LOC115225419 [Octopus sinensis]XP_036370165.1 uncharacterized protein LOC115225419 [Octopus sinensis]
MMETIKTEADAVSYLQEKGIIPKIKVCKNKKHYMLKKVRGRNIYWRCSHRGCMESVSVRKGTWLEGRTLPLRTVVLFLHSWVKELTSVQFCVEKLGMSHSTAVEYNCFVREICAEDLIRNPVKIGGPGKIVEMDETVFSRLKYNHGEILPEQWVYGGVCLETREVFLYAVPCRNRDTLEECIQKLILPGTTIYSDMWRAYSHIPEIDGYYFEHGTVNQSIAFVKLEDGTDIQQVESTQASIKEGIKRRRGTHPSMVDSYLCEFMWRRKYENCNLLDKLLECIANFRFS